MECNEHVLFWVYIFANNVVCFNPFKIPSFYWSVCLVY